MYEEKIKELGYEIKDAPKPLAAYVPFVISGNLVFTAGQIPLENGKVNFTGKAGSEVDLETAKKAAEICVLNCLSAVKSACNSLDNIKKIVKITVFVASDSAFTDQPKVANGASELLVKIFGEAGEHARSAVGVTALPLDSTVEIEMIAEIKN